MFFAAALPAKVVRYFAGFLIIEDNARSGLREHSYNRRADSARASGNDGNAAFQRQDNSFSRHGKYDTEQHAIARKVSERLRIALMPFAGRVHKCLK